MKTAPSFLPARCCIHLAGRLEYITCVLCNCRTWAELNRRLAPQIILREQRELCSFFSSSGHIRISSLCHQTTQPELSIWCIYFQSCPHRFPSHLVNLHCHLSVTHYRGPCLHHLLHCLLLWMVELSYLTSFIFIAVTRSWCIIVHLHYYTGMHTQSLWLCFYVTQCV